MCWHVRWSPLFSPHLLAIVVWCVLWLCGGMAVLGIVACPDEVVAVLSGGGVGGNSWQWQRL